MRQLDLNLLATAIVKRHDEGYTPTQIAKAVQKLLKFRVSPEVINFFLKCKGKSKNPMLLEEQKQEIINDFYVKNIRKADLMKKYDITLWHLDKILTQSVEYKNSLRKENNDGC